MECSGGFKLLTLLTGYLIFFFSRVIDVSLSTVRVLMLMRGNKLWAGVLGFFEAVVYVVVLKLVMQGLTDPLAIVFYALGFASGNVVGIMLEERLALGFITVQIITLKDEVNFSMVLRDAGFGVSIVPCQGRSGSHHMLSINTARKSLKKLQHIINTLDENAFITIINSHSIKGGYFSAATRIRK